MKLLLPLILFAATAFGQIADPPYDEPYAQLEAELRFGYSMFGMASPPVGWDCSWVPMGEFPYQPQTVYCTPSPGLVNSQQEQYDAWVRNFYRNAAVVRESIKRRR